MKRGEPLGILETLLKLTTMNAADEQEVYQKQRRRQAEYIGLTTFQAVIGWLVRDFLRFDTGCAIAICAFLLGWMLARLREQRRTLEVANKSRILTDALESLLLMFLLAIGTILALKAGVELLIVQAHLCVFFVCYFLGSWQSEVHWRKQFLARLEYQAGRNYLLNLNRSVIFPYNSTFLRSLFRK